MDRADEQAKAALLQRLASEPRDTRALVELGNLALRNGYRSAACTAYRRAIEIDPSDPAVRVNLGNALLQGGDLAGAREAYEVALHISADFAPAHQGLSFVFSRQGDESFARRHRDLGFTGNALQKIPYRGSGTAQRVLVFVSTAGGDFNTAELLDARTFEVTKVFVEYTDVLPHLPAPYAIVNAIGDADRCRSALLAAANLLGKHGTPAVVNSPRLVLQTDRLQVMNRLRSIPGVTVPRVALVRRAQLDETAFAYPFLIRAPGHHTGRHFVMVEHPGELDAKAAALPGEDLLAIEFLDVRHADGLFRKYRVLAVAGELFPVHVAASMSWKVHFFTSTAGEEEAHRAEDARFLARPREVTGERVWEALQAIVDELQLDYMGLDFGIDAQGRLVVFEANATMSVYPVPADPRWAYRREATARIVSAFADLVALRYTKAHGHE